MPSSNAILEAALFKELAPLFKPYGFTKRWFSFQRKYDWGRTTFFLANILHVADFDVTLDVGIRFNAVEDLIQRFDMPFPGVPEISEKEQKETYTFGIELGNYVEGFQVRYSVTCDHDIPKVADAVEKRFVEVALPFFERYNVMENALELSCCDDFPERLMAFPGRRAQNAVAMACLLKKDRRDIDALIENRRAYLASCKDDEYLQTICACERYEYFVSRLFAEAR